MGRNRLMIIDSVNKSDYVVIRGNGGLYITVAIRDDSRHIIDPAQVIFEKEDFEGLKKILKGGELTDKYGRKLSFVKAKRMVIVEITEREKRVSVFIRRRDFGKLWFYFLK